MPRRRSFIGLTPKSQINRKKVAIRWTRIKTDRSDSVWDEITHEGKLLSSISKIWRRK